MPSANSTAARITSPWLTTTTVAVAVGAVQIEQGADGPVLDLAHAFASGHGSNAAAGSPQFPALVRADLVEGQPGPLAEIQLHHVFAIADRQSEPGGQDLGRLLGALQRARIERRDGVAGETLGDRGDLAAAPLGQSDPGRAPSKHPTGQDVLAVPHQMKHRHRR